MVNEKVENISIHHVALLAKDFERSIKFYTEGLGFTVTRQWGEGEKRAAMLDIGNGACFEIFASGSDEEQKNARFIHIAFGTENVDLAYENAIKAGAVSHKEPADIVIKSDPPLPGRNAFVKGPDGELLEFMQ